MKFVKFLNLLNKKIDKYNSVVSNPFDMARNITIVWVEDVQPINLKKKNDLS
ncbi:hypothetical protein IKJ53_03185 [bacterium]|nr:hypothetical protein [bacterium]